MRVAQTAEDFDGVRQLWGFPLEVVLVDTEGEEHLVAVLVEGEDEVFSFCLEYEVQSVYVDPDRRVLLGEIVEGDGQLGVDSCGEFLAVAVDTGATSDTGSGGVDLETSGGCGCASSPSTGRFGWLAQLFVIMAITLKRREV
jgi:hypothetical protein